MAHGVATVIEETPGTQKLRRQSPFDILGVLLFTVLGFLVMGYHPGLEDDGVYLTAVKARLNPSLYPYNADFFKLQLEATQFDNWMAHFVRWTHMSLSWAELSWQLISLFLILWALKKIANELFESESARWGGVALSAAMFTLPVAGTALYLVDQHLHPRSLATALILLAVWRILCRRSWQAVPLLVIALLMHPLMAALGISFCVFLTLSSLDVVQASLRPWREMAAAFLPLGWVLEPAGQGWKQALDTKTYYDLYKWPWYEWLGALAPLLLFFLLWRMAQQHGQPRLARFTLALFLYGIFHQVVAMALLGTPSLVRVIPFQPMRYLHLVYFFFVLVAGCFLGEYVLQRSPWRWAVFLLIANGTMFFWQRIEFAVSQHLELPGRQPTNAWVQAFVWIKENTPEDAFFALDPHFMDSPGEDYHSFRALAERSQLADAVKDAAVVTEVPELGSRWLKQVQAQAGWNHFRLADFERLKAEFGVDWALVSYPAPAGLACRWHNRSLAACQIP